MTLSSTNKNGAASNVPGRLARFWAWSARHPGSAIVLISFLSVIINCYPVIFAGKSFVSPAEGVGLVYDRWPPLPGMDRAAPPWQHYSDTSATSLWDVPLGFLESRSVLDHGELPLWNRYSHAGDTLIGQAVSMIGDPLQLIVIFGHGSAIAWDLKYLVAKFLFCLGFGLLVNRLLANVPLALIYTVLGAYCGAFFYTNNHPAFFVFCYAPWILVSALAWLDLKSDRWPGWAAVWLVANAGCFNAGDVELGVVLIGALNLAATVFTLRTASNVGEAVKVIGRMAVGTMFFLALTAPVWMSFLGALDGAYTVHSEVRVTQMPVWMLAAVFDDLFYLFGMPGHDYHFIAPGTSLLIAVGFLFSIFRWRQFKHDRFFLVNGVAIVLWAGCIYGWVPAAVLRAVPFLNRVGHIHVDFSFVLVFHLTVQSAYGFKSLLSPATSRRLVIEAFGIALIFAGVAAMYCFGVRHYALPGNYFLEVTVAALAAPLLFSFLKNRYAHMPAWGGLAILVLGIIPEFRFGLYHVGTDLVLRPGPRVVLNPPSPSVDHIKADTTAPFRVTGEGWNFLGDYPAVYGLEDIRSCAPLSNARYISLAGKFPGMDFGHDWILRMLDPYQAHALLNMLNVKYVLFSSPMDSTNGFRVFDTNDFCVLENLEVWPRAFFTDKVVALDDEDAFIKYLAENGKDPFVALNSSEMEMQPALRPLLRTVQPSVTPATGYQLRPNSTAFDIHAPSAGVVCLTEEQARGFTVRVDGERKPVLTVNRVFKGVYVDRPGDHHVEFVYRPAHWRIACILFWTAFAGVLAAGGHTLSRRGASGKRSGS